ncbi:MAG: LptF/LptG family permease [Planctomycetia bacterium]|nr:LptF/LptG family permease [Planctomycetia bacterium]
MKIFKIIPTSILLELLVTFLIMQVGFTLIFVVIGIFLQDVLSKMPITQIPYLIPYVFPFAQSFCGQLVMVFTCVMIYSRITQSHEILALQSSGISAWRVMAPSFFLAFLMSILSFWMADLNCSWGRQGIQSTLLSSMETIIYKTLETEKCFQFSDDYFLSVSDVEGKTLKGLFVTSKDSQETRLFSAESAQLTIGPANQVISPEEVCYTKNGEIYSFNSDDTTSIAKLFVYKPDFQVNQSQMTSTLERTIVITLDELNKITNSSKQRISMMSLTQLNDFIESCLQDIQLVRQEMSQKCADNIFEGKFVDFTTENWKIAYYDKIKYLESQIRRAKIEPTRRLAFAFNCFCLTWVCAPLSLKRGNAGALVLICVSIVPLLFMYYPLFMATLEIVKDTSCSPLLLWLPNLGLLLLGTGLIRKAL